MEETITWEWLPTECWTDIFIRLNSTNKYGEIIYDMETMLEIMTASKYFFNIVNIDYIWRNFCSTFRDFERLQFMHDDQNVSWKNVYKIRITGVLQTHEVKIGDQENPQDCILFQIMGNGKLYISTDWMPKERCNGL